MSHHHQSSHLVLSGSHDLISFDFVLMTLRVTGEHRHTRNQDPSSSKVRPPHCVIWAFSNCSLGFMCVCRCRAVVLCSVVLVTRLQWTLLARSFDLNVAAMIRVKGPWWQSLGASLFSFYYNDSTHFRFLEAALIDPHRLLPIDRGDGGTCAITIFPPFVLLLFSTITAGGYLPFFLSWWYSNGIQY